MIGGDVNPPHVVEPLTAREIEVLHLVVQGRSNQEVADELVISERTVRTHVMNVYGKLGLGNRVQLTLYALKMGLVTLDGWDEQERNARRDRATVAFDAVWTEAYLAGYRDGAEAQKGDKVRG